MSSNYANVKSIKDARKERGLSISSAANLMGLDEVQLTYYEHNPEDTPIKIAKMMGEIYDFDYDLISFLHNKGPSVI